MGLSGTLDFLIFLSVALVIRNFNYQTSLYSEFDGYHDEGTGDYKHESNGKARSRQRKRLNGR